MDVKLYTTNLEQEHYWNETSCPIGQADATHCVCLYPEIRGQTFEGFGGAFTEAAGLTFNALCAADRKAVTEAYYGREGLGYVLGRVPLGSCDFAIGNYSCIDDPDDEALQTFTLARENATVFPLLRASGEAAGAPVRLLLSPWSPPAFMKTNGEMNHGGKLRPEYYTRWAACMAEYVRRYHALGFAPSLISVQNEPDATQTWDSCLYTAKEEAIFAADFLVPALKRLGEDVGILIWDHNKEQLVRRCESSFSDPRQAEKIYGVGFHWYTGDHFEAVALAQKLFSDKRFYFTEGCVEYSRFDGMDDRQKAEMYAHDIIGNLNAGTVGSFDWNLLLDAKGGPNHVGNFCEAPIMVTGDGSFEKKGSYWYIGHFSRYIRPAAVRIGLSRYCSDIEATAFVNTNGTTVVVLLNRTAHPLPVSLCDGLDRAANFALSPHTIATALFPKQG